MPDNSSEKEPAQDDVPAVVDDSDDNAIDEDFAPPPAMMRKVEQFFGMSVGPRRDPIVEKMDSDQITQVIANAEKSNERRHLLDLSRENSRRLYSAVAAILIIGICWMFLAYDKTEHIDAVISAIVGILGGYGFGKASSSNGS